MNKTVYADNAATTQICDEALNAMLPFLKDNFANPSGVYSLGVLARSAINEARHKIADSLKAYDKEIIFTAGGSEADNLALIGVMGACRSNGRHLITTNIEHHAILESCGYLERNGFRVTYVPVKENGIVEPQDIENAICDDTVLISVMFSNNELGTLQPVKEIGEIAHRHNILFHTDAVQAYGKVKIIPDEINADLLSASGHKFNGPKGSGFLYVKSGTPIEAFIHGGSQERRLRGGTENVPAIVGMAAAAEFSFANMDEHRQKEKFLRDNLWEKIDSSIDGVRMNGDPDNRMPGILNITIDGVEGSSLLIILDMKGIAASSGSACAQSLDEPSHVLRAIGRTEKEARGSLRFSLSYKNTVEDIDYIAKKLKECVEYLRSMN